MPMTEGQAATRRQRLISRAAARGPADRIPIPEGTLGVRPGSRTTAGAGAGAGAGGVRSAGAQGDALRNPGTVSAKTPVNPMQQRAYDAASSFESGIADETNQEITRELGRFRDEISTGMQAEGEAAMARGADPTLFRTRALAAGQRDMTNLQGRLADAALGRHQGAIDSLTGAAGSAAGEQRLTHFSSLAAQLEQQRQLLDEAEFARRVEDAPFQRALDLMGAAGAGADTFDFPGFGGYSPVAGSAFGSSIMIGGGSGGVGGGSDYSGSGNVLGRRRSPLG